MPVCRRWSLLGLALCLAAAPAARADKLDKEGKKWLEEVKPIILPEEEKAFRDAKDKGERDEFQKIFWARRNPEGPESASNPFRAEYETARTRADARFKSGGLAGSQTDCGRVFILLGEPDAVTKPTAGEASRGGQFWVYKDRPGLKFKDGQIQVPFDETCQLPQGARFAEQLTRVAESSVAHPNIGYRRGADGRLVKLADQLPKPTPVMALLKAPRQDFAAAAENDMFLRSPDGGTYVAGLVRAEANAVAAEDVGGKKVGKVVVGLQALQESGEVSASSEREVVADVGADGSLVASYGITLKPGTYTLRVGVLDPKTGKGAVASQALPMPDFSVDELTVSPLLVLRDVQESQPDSKDPLSAFQLGTMKMMARFGNVFARDEAVTLLTFLYSAKVDEATGKASVTVKFAILKDGKPVARADDQNYDTPAAGPSVGPVQLETYAPGKYVAQVKVRDNVAGKEHTRETLFEIR